ncbi:MAG: HXXEE domain-containing protein [Alphaproteobacteria bacterium]|nr:HXXEE domain-containing protein [Alphaproteobacteria bacterium]MBQ9235137.1 HXXEE domain-containing protein [Alphaproteobacteria bacterium]
MIKFIRFYALEIYTVISMQALVIAGIVGDLSVIQKFVLVYIFLFVLHEWEEMRYPGGFADLIAKMIGVGLDEKMKRQSRITTSILLLTFTITPLIFHQYPITILPLAFLGLFEGLVHIFAIRLFKCPGFYSPGLVTAEIQAIVSIILFVYLIRNNIAAGFDFVIGFVCMVVCFVLMQRTLTKMVGIKYSDLPKMLKKQLEKK